MVGHTRGPRYIMAVCGAALVVGAALLVPQLARTLFSTDRMDRVMGSTKEAFAEGVKARSASMDNEPVPAASRHAAFLLGYLSSILPGCSLAGMNTVAVFATCRGPDGYLQADSNYPMTLTALNTKRAQFDYDGRPYDSRGKRIVVPDSGNNIQLIGFHFEGDNANFIRISNALLASFTHHKIADIPPNGIWDEQPPSQFGIRSCFLSRNTNLVSAVCFPSGEGAS